MSLQVCVPMQNYFENMLGPDILDLHCTVGAEFFHLNSCNFKDCGTFLYSGAGSLSGLINLLLT